jgi:hypothetical protein
MTSDGLPAPAGFSSSRNSNLLQANLDPDASIFSDPLMFNNIFWDNRAGTWTGGGVAGIGLDGDTSPILYWDLGVTGDAGELSPTYTLMQAGDGEGGEGNLVGQNPLVVQEYDLAIRVFPWRGAPNFIGADVVAVDLPASLLGDYHLTADSPANNTGIDPAVLIAELNQDYDRQSRPSQGRFEIGADEISAAFPNTPILFSEEVIAQAAALQEPAASIQADHMVFMPIVRIGEIAPVAEWGGDTESFVFDLPTGIDVLDSGTVYWNQTLFGRDQEAYFTFNKVSETAARQDLLLKVGGLDADNLRSPDTYLLDIRYDATTGTVQVITLSPGNLWQTYVTFGGISFTAGDQFGARATRGGLVYIYENGNLIGQTDLSAGNNPWPYHAEPGKIGLWFEWPVLTTPDGASITGFGGGTMPW